MNEKGGKLPGSSGKTGLKPASSGLAGKSINAPKSSPSLGLGKNDSKGFSNKSSNMMGFGGKSDNILLGKSASPLGSATKSSNSYNSISKMETLKIEKNSGCKTYTTSFDKSPGLSKKPYKDIKAPATGKNNNLSSGEKSHAFGAGNKISSPITAQDSKLNKGSSPLDFIGKQKSDVNTQNTVGKIYSSPLYESSKTKKSKTAFGIIWLPTKKRNKHKQSAYSTYQDHHFPERSPSMYMSGDSTEHQPYKKKEAENDLLLPERTRAPVSAVVTTGTAVTSTEVQVPPPDSDTSNAEEKQEFIKHDREDNKESASDLNDKDSRKDDKDYLENDNIRSKSPEKWDKEKDTGDKVDSVFIAPKLKPPQSTTSNTEEDDCGIKCLYYTLQCCDCVLM